MAAKTDDALLIGGIIFPEIDQADFTGPFEVLSRLPNSKFLVIGRDLLPVHDAKGLILTPQKSYADTPALDVLVVPGGAGVNALLGDRETLAFLRRQAESARVVLSICTGALLCGAAGLLKKRRATTHWASHQFLRYFGAIPDKNRVVVDGKMVSAAGVTSGIDAALVVAARLRGDQIAQEIQLYLEYAPAPPFRSGCPTTAPKEVVEAVRATMLSTQLERESIIRRITADWI